MKNLISVKSDSALLCIKQSLKLFWILLAVVLVSVQAHATVTITKATGGTSISADKAENAVSPLYTTLGNIVITEGAGNDFSTGTNVSFTLIAPSGWKFNPMSLISVSAGPGGDINSVSVTGVTASLITLQFSVTGTTNSDVLTISGLQIRAVEGGNIPSTANIIRGGTASIYGCAAGSILANLSQVTGAINKLVITLPGQGFSDASLASTSGNSGTPNTQTAGTPFTITKIRACDQFYNVVTGYFGVKTLTFSGPSNGQTAPNYTTSVSFASGVSSTALTTTLKRAETTSITVSDGTYSGPASSPLTVTPGVHSKFIVEAAGGGSIGTHVTGIPFDIRITAADANNNPCITGGNVFSGTVDVTSSGVLESGEGTTAPFTSGVLALHSVSFLDAGSFTISVTETGGSQTGISNSFVVNYPLASLTGISPSCVTPGDPQFMVTVDGSNFNPSSTVRFNGADRTTFFVDPYQLMAIIPASDIAVADVYSISVFTPGTGSSAPLIINMNSTSTANVSICQGDYYELPDGSFENTAGTYQSVIPTVAGCDSIITTNLTVNTSFERTQDVYICPGSDYLLPDGSLESFPGTYVSVVQNQGTCDSVITTNLYFHDSPVISATAVQIDCYGNKGSVLLSATNGLAPYSYGPEPTTNLLSGTYDFTVTDANGCTDMISATIDPEPDELILTATPTQIACFGGTGEVDLVASGGTPGYSISGDQTTNLAAGTYNYQVIDNNGCVVNETVTINAAPAVLNASTSVLNTPCGLSNGAASVNVTGGTAPYTYEWDDAGMGTTNSITGLPTGTYTVIVTDDHFCTVTKTATVGNSNPITVNITGSTGICPGGTTTLCASSGFASYEWSNGETSQCITVSSADTFYVTAMDLNGCIGSKSIVTRNSVPPVCSITGGTLCPNSILVLRAPTGYSSYLWSNGVRTATSSVRSAGTYSVTIKNTDGCASTCSYTVNTPLRATVTKSDGKCSNEYKGSATVNASAGIPPYTYAWTGGATTATASGLAAGTYIVRVADAGGCALSYSATITANKATNDYSTISATFNNNAINPGSTIWFSAVANITYTGNYPVTIRFINQNINAAGINIAPANAKLIITNAVSQASTVFTGGEWVTTAPPNLSGNYFVSGHAFPVTTAIAANLASVKWKGIWTSSSSCLTTLHWKWSAATYSSMTTSNASINVQPVDDITASPYYNSDFAGTPENFKNLCIPGALSTGSPNFVGTYTLVANRQPCSTPDVCNSLRTASLSDMTEEGSNFIAYAYPNPFSYTTNLEFERIDKSGRVSIEIYSFWGEKLKTVFEGEIEAGVRYTFSFDAGELKDGIYFYKIKSDDEEMRGKLYLQR